MRVNDSTASPIPSSGSRINSKCPSSRAFMSMPRFYVPQKYLATKTNAPADDESDRGVFVLAWLVSRNVSRVDRNVTSCATPMWLYARTTSPGPCSGRSLETLQARLSWTGSATGTGRRPPGQAARQPAPAILSKTRDHLPFWAGPRYRFAAKASSQAANASERHSSQTSTDSRWPMRFGATLISTQPLPGCSPQQSHSTPGAARMRFPVPSHNPHDCVVMPSISSS